jgi:hypothetical protein
MAHLTTHPARFFLLLVPPLLLKVGSLGDFVLSLDFWAFFCTMLATDFPSVPSVSLSFALAFSSTSREPMIFSENSCL